MIISAAHQRPGTPDTGSAYAKWHWACQRQDMRAPGSGDHIMNRHDIRLSWVDAEILEDWDEDFAEFIKRLLRIPDIVNHNAIFRSEARMMEPAGRPTLTCCVEPPDRFVILLRAHRRGVEIQGDCHDYCRLLRYTGSVRPRLSLTLPLTRNIS
jgi:hypothetical protein